MKTLLLAIISAIGIGLGIAALMIFGNISPALPPSHDWNSGTLIDTPGLSNSYRVGDTAKFSILIHGFTNHRCATPAIMLYGDNQPDKPIINYSSSLMSCPINDTSSYTLYLPSKSDNFSATFERPGPYTLDILFDKDESIQTHFLVTGFDKTNDLSVNDCGKFYTVPENKTYLNTVPVLLMKSNATGCFKLTFTVTDTSDTDSTYRLAILRQELGFQIGNYNMTTNGHSLSIFPGKDHTNSFEVVYMSQTVDSYPANYRIGDDPANYPTGTNFTETFLIKALQNAKGFYDYSLPGPHCSRYPLAVGYTSDQVNSSDFSKVSPLGQTCQRSPYELTSVQISGMSYKELQLEQISFEVGK